MSLAQAGLENEPWPIVASIQKLQMAFTRRYQKLVDSTTPHLKHRWAFTAAVFLIYVIRVFILQGFHIVTYALGIYELNLLIGFLSPLADPEENDDGTLLPGSDSKSRGDASISDWKPFLRKVPEFKFWHLSTRFLIGCFFATFVPFLDIPVVWQILLVYFIILMVFQLKGRIQHMIKHRYFPGSLGKPTYDIQASRLK